MRLIDDKTEIGNRLLKARKNAGFTQSEVAEKASISERTYADIERGTKNMRVDTLCRICIALNITPDYLLADYDKEELPHSQEEVLSDFMNSPPRHREIGIRIIAAYLRALNEL